MSEQTKVSRDNVTGKYVIFAVGTKHKEIKLSLSIDKMKKSYLQMDGKGMTCVLFEGFYPN